MSQRDLTFGKDARKELKAGVDKLADAEISATLNDLPANQSLFLLNQSIYFI